METLLSLLAFAVASSLGLLLARKRRQTRLRAWRLAAEMAGLTDVRLEEGGILGVGALLGRSGDLQVRLEVDSSGERESGTKIAVGGPGHGAGGLTLRREGLSTALEKRVVGDREIQVGDPMFDDEYYVQGWAALVLALLDADTRATLAALLRNRVATSRGEPVKAGTSLIDGVLSVRVKDGALSTNLRRLPEVVAAVIEAARRLVAPDDLAARIAANLRTEPVAGVRLQCLATLAREFPGHPATREALLRAREDKDAEVRLRAGIALGPEGRDVILAVAGGEDAPDEASARAVGALAGELSVDETTALLRSALRTRRLATALACLRLLGRRGGPGAAGALARVLAVETGLRHLPERTLATVAAEALGDTRDPSAETPLLAALESPSTIVRVAAARALGRAGTSVAVQPLKELEDRDPSCRAAARQAIAEIQSRLTGAEPGQLSLAGGESGQLSLAEGEEGRLSLAAPSRRASGGSDDEGSADTADSSGPGPTGVAQVKE